GGGGGGGGGGGMARDDFGGGSFSGGVPRTGGGAAAVGGRRGRGRRATATAATRGHRGRRLSRERHLSFRERERSRVGDDLRLHALSKRRAAANPERSSGNTRDAGADREDENRRCVGYHRHARDRQQ